MTGWLRLPFGGRFTESRSGYRTFRINPTVNSGTTFVGTCRLSVMYSFVVLDEENISNYSFRYLAQVTNNGKSGQGGPHLRRLTSREDRWVDTTCTAL